MRKFIIGLAVAALGLSSLSSAQPGNDPYYVGPMASYYWLEDDRPFTNVDHDAPAVGAVLGWNIDEAQAWEISAQGGDDVTAIGLTYIRHLSDRSSWSPYVLGGVSWLEDHNAPDQAESSMDIQVGAGVSKLLEKGMEFRFDVRPMWIAGGTVNSNGWDLSANAALLWHFGAQPAPAPVMPEPAPEPEPQMRTITIRLNVLFDFDRSEVKAVYGDELQQVADAMKAHNDIELVLEGHTDWVGTDQYNQGLSQRRVDAVKAKLVQDYGIPADRISTEAYGESRPIASNETDEGRAQNRRVVGVISWTEVAQ